MRELHKKISDKAAQNNTNYKLWSDIRNILKTFNVGDAKKVYACSAGPIQILKKLRDNAYVIDILKQFDISSTFNVKGLVDYKVLVLSHWLLSLLLSLFFRVLYFLHSKIFYLTQHIKLIKS